MKSVIAILWVSAMFIIGIARNLDSFSSWAVLTGVAVISESIQEARK
jgi:hypothetical protein